MLTVATSICGESTVQCPVSHRENEFTNSDENTDFWTRDQPINSGDKAYIDHLRNLPPEYPTPLTHISCPELPNQKTGYLLRCKGRSVRGKIKQKPTKQKSKQQNKTNKKVKLKKRHVGLGALAWWWECCGAFGRTISTATAKRSGFNTKTHYNNKIYLCVVYFPPTFLSNTISVFPALPFPLAKATQTSHT